MIGDRNSYVFGSILDGVFEGKIITERDAYYVEHAKRYFPTTNATAAAANGAQMPLAQRRVAEQYFGTTTTTTLTTSTTSATRTTSPAPAPETTTSTTTASMTTTSERTLKASPTSGGNHKNGQTDDNRNTGFHSIIYKESHVDDAYKDVREGRSRFVYVTFTYIVVVFIQHKLLDSNLVLCKHNILEVSTIICVYE